MNTNSSTVSDTLELTAPWMAAAAEAVSNLDGFDQSAPLEARIV